MAFTKKGEQANCQLEWEVAEEEEEEERLLLAEEIW